MPEYNIELENGLVLHIVGPQNAIDRVEQLVKENERLKAALREIADRRDYQIPTPQDIARNALKENGDD